MSFFNIDIHISKSSWLITSITSSKENPSSLRKINIARYEKEDEEFNKELKANPIPSSMMQIIYNFSLAKPKSRKQGVKIQRTPLEWSLTSYICPTCLLSLAACKGLLCAGRRYDACRPQRQLPVLQISEGRPLR